jgi:hypothetical protein
MRKDGDGRLQPDGAPAFGDQEPKEHPKRSRTFLGCSPSTRSTGLQDKVPKAPGIKPVRLLSEASEQLAYVDCVIIDGAFTGAALLAHPLPERPQQSRIMSAGLDCSDRDGTYLL